MFREFLCTIGRELKEIMNKLRKSGTLMAMLLTGDECGQGHHQKNDHKTPVQSYLNAQGESPYNG